MASKRLWLILTLCACLGFCGSVHSATLHAIVVCHTQDISVGSGIKANLGIIKSQLKLIAQGAELKLSARYFCNQSFDSDLVLTYIENLAVEPDDVVFYYHSSHGFRIESMREQWPALCFGEDSRPLRLLQVINKIERKPHRFTFVLAEVCNGLCEGGDPSMFGQNVYAKKTMSIVEKSNYRTLFREFRGTVVTSSSKPGQYSWIDLSAGGYYTRGFFAALNNHLKKDPWLISWPNILQEASANVAKMLRRLDVEQNPISAILDRSLPSPSFGPENSISDSNSP